MPPSVRNTAFRILGSLVLFLVASAAALGVSELVLRQVQPPWDGRHYHLWQPGLYRTLRPSADVMPGVTGDAHFIVNTDGFRGDERGPAGQRRILAIGGSTTECLYLDQDEAWPQVLQQLLVGPEATSAAATPGGVWVGNAGMAGMTTRHHLVALRHLPLRDLGIDTVIVLTGINDFTIRLSRDNDWRPVDLSSPEVDLQFTAENFVGSNIYPPNAPFYQHTVLWTMLRKASRAWAKVSVQDEAGESYRTWREHRREAGEIRDTLPDLTTALDEYTRLLTEMAQVAQQKSVRLILVTQPTLWREDLPADLERLLWLGGIGDFLNVAGQPYYSTAALARGIDLYNDRLRQVCATGHVECLDLARDLPRDDTVFYDDVHFNENGARLVAARIKAVLASPAPISIPARVPAS